MLPGRFHKTVFACLLGLACVPHAVAAPFGGAPPVVSFTPRLDVYPQNFALAQSEDGVLYVGNNDGVLVFDGERWRLVRLPNGDIARSLAADGAGRVYVGGFDQFGWFERDATGREQFHDLTARFAALLAGETFADVWGIRVTPEGVFFRAVQHLFLYEPSTQAVSLWRHEGRFGGMTRYRDETVVQFRGEGLRRFDGSNWEPLPGTGALRELIYDFLVLRDDSLLMLSTDGRWLRYGDGRVSAFRVPQGFPPSSNFTQGMLTRDGRIALATQDGALVILDADENTSQRFELATGFISALIPSRDGGLFMLSNAEVLRVDWPATWMVSGKEHGLPGAVHDIATWNGRWFLLTDAGVYEPSAVRGGGFARRDWTGHEAWDLLALDDGSALLAESYVLSLVRDGKSRALTGTDFYPRHLQRSLFDRDVVYAGTERGFAILRRDGDTWRVVLDVNDLDASSVTGMVQVSARELWLATMRGGVMHVRLSPALDAVESLETADEEDGIVYGDIRTATIARLADGRVIVSTSRGFFTPEGGGFILDPVGGLDVLRGASELLTIAVAPSGVEWAYSFNHVFSRASGGEWRAHDVSSQLRGAIDTVAFDESGAPMFGATASVLRYQPVDPPPAGSSPVALRSVEFVRSDGTSTPLPLQTPQALEFGPDDVNLEFRYSLPEYAVADGVRYSARMKGLETQWSDWSGASGFAYHRMRPGDYELELRARDSNGRETSIEPWRFRVFPHWYASRWAMALWILLGIAAMTFAMLRVSQRRTDRLAAETRRLEGMVAERTQELEDANRKLEAIAHLDGLTEIPNRRRLDAYLQHVWQQCVERERPLSVLVIDVDRFKHYNDRHGHIAGDQLLQKLARILSRSLRRSEDLVARYGGEEFLIVLPGAELETAIDLAESIRETVESSSLGATVSIGLASDVPMTRNAIMDLVNRADAALYEAKAAGRNCVRADAPDDVVS